LLQEQQIIIVDNLKKTWIFKILFVYLHIMKNKEKTKEKKEDFGYFDRYKNQNNPKTKKETLEISLFSRYKD